MWISQHQWTVIWVAAVLACGGLILRATLAWLRRTRERRQHRVSKRRTMDAVPTSSPFDNPIEIEKARAVESIHQHHRTTRRLLAPVIIAGTLIVASLPLVGRVPAAYLSLVVAAFTILVGSAARPVIENAISGLVISMSKRINIGDTVRIDELFGTVEDISPTHTTIKLWDWRRYVVPNRKMLDSNFLNYSIIDAYQWAYVEFWVAHDADIDEVGTLAVDAAKRSPDYRDYEPPRFWVMELGKEGVRCWIAAWTDNPGSAWNLMHDTRTELVREFQRRGIRAHAFRHDVECVPR